VVGSGGLAMVGGRRENKIQVSGLSLGRDVVSNIGLGLVAW